MNSNHLFLPLLLLASPLAHAEVKTGKLDLGPVMHYVASPKFAKLLADATEFANGWKIRIDYQIDNASRTTKECIEVTVVGQVPDAGDSAPRYQKATFSLQGVNGGWEIGDGVVAKTAITRNEFAQFKE